MNKKILIGFNLLLSTLSAVLSMLVAFDIDTTIHIKIFSGIILTLSLTLVCSNVVYLVVVNENE